MASPLQSQLLKLQQKQKSARINNEHANSVSVLKDIISLCYNAKDIARLTEQIKYLMNRRGQSKKAQIDMIQLAMTWLPTMEEPHRTQLIECIKEVCAKKIYLEVEYARCVMLIVKGKEDQNDITQAATILQEVQVETYGSMDKREKLQFILYQMKIMIKKKDFVRLFVISKKVNEKNINQADIVDLKINYYGFMVIYYLESHDYKELCRCYRIMNQVIHLLPTEKLPQIDSTFSLTPFAIISNYIGFLTLQPYSKETQSQLTTLSQKQSLESSPHLLHIINSLLKEQLISCDIAAYQLQLFELFTESYPSNGEHREQLRKMLVQHNIRIISMYYGCISLERISQLLQTEKDYCEEQLCTLNQNKVLICRVDRVDDVVNFMPLENDNLILENWNEAINNVLDLVDVASKLIHREREVYLK